MSRAKTPSELSAEAKKMYAESAALSIENLISLLSTDSAFASALASDPRGTLDSAGIKLEKEAVELLIATDPDRFDQVCDSLFALLDPDLLSKLVAPSCGIEIQRTESTYDLKFVPRKT